MSPDYKEVLEAVYEYAAHQVDRGDFSYNFDSYIASEVALLVDNSEEYKGVLTVLITLVTTKIVMPNQDIRLHQANMNGGFSGRTYDTKFVTPFLKSQSFPAPAESGWLTRSLEQPFPYDLKYPGKIRNKDVKKAFLHLIDAAQERSVEAEHLLIYIFELLIKQRDNEKQLELAKPNLSSISAIVELFRRHITYKYSCSGAARLPVLAIYATYQCMIEEMARFNDKQLLPLKSHTAADHQTGMIGDIEITNNDGSAFEGIEIKHEVPISSQLVLDAYEKFKNEQRINRYYLLTTADISNERWDDIEKAINDVARIHGCQVIVDNVYNSLSYYLRTLNNPADVIDKYVELMKQDEVVKYPHKKVWNEVQGIK